MPMSFEVIEAGDLSTPKKKKKTVKAKKTVKKVVKPKAKKPPKPKTVKTVKKVKKKKTSEEEVFFKEKKVKPKKKKSEVVKEKTDEKKPKKVKKKLPAKLSSQDEELSSSFDEALQQAQESEVLSVEDRDQMKEYVKMFTQLRKISRNFEKKAMNGSSKDVYALMKIYDQMREIIADLKALKDISALADNIQTDVLRPYVRTTVSEVANIRSQILIVGKRLLAPEHIPDFTKEVDNAILVCGQNLSAAYDNARIAVVEMYEDG